MMETISFTERVTLTLTDFQSYFDQAGLELEQVWQLSIG
jgi:hypothetical protein